MAEQWRLVGDFVDFCKCAVPCPCTFGRSPTEGDCAGIIAFRIREGSYGNVDRKAEGSSELLTGPTSTPGQRLAVHNPPGSEVGPGQGPATYGIASTQKADAFGLSQDYSGR